MFFSSRSAAGVSASHEGLDPLLLGARSVNLLWLDCSRSGSELLDESECASGMLRCLGLIVDLEDG